MISNEVKWTKKSKFYDIPNREYIWGDLVYITKRILYFIN